jgi:hypothetical protein
VSGSSLLLLLSLNVIAKTSLARSAIAFALCDHFINPSRADPTAIHMRELQSTNPRFHAYIGDRPAVFISCIFSELCKLQSLSTVGLRQKLLQGKFHSVEWQRFMSFVCMISGFHSLHANLARDSMHFVTRPLVRKEEQMTGMYNGYSGQMCTDVGIQAPRKQRRGRECSLEASSRTVC